MVNMKQHLYGKVFLSERFLEENNTILLIIIVYYWLILFFSVVSVTLTEMTRLSEENNAN